MGKNETNTVVSISLPDTPEGKNARVEFAQVLLEDRSLKLSEEEILHIVELTKEKLMEALKVPYEPPKRENESPIAENIRLLKKVIHTTGEMYVPEGLYPSLKEDGISITYSPGPQAEILRAHFVETLWHLGFIKTEKHLSELGGPGRNLKNMLRALSVSEDTYY